MPLSYPCTSKYLGYIYNIFLLKFMNKPTSLKLISSITIKYINMRKRLL